MISSLLDRGTSFARSLECEPLALLPTGPPDEHFPSCSRACRPLQTARPSSPGWSARRPDPDHRLFDLPAARAASLARDPVPASVISAAETLVSDIVGRLTTALMAVTAPPEHRQQVRPAGLGFAALVRRRWSLAFTGELSRTADQLSSSIIAGLLLAGVSSPLWGALSGGRL